MNENLKYVFCEAWQYDCCGQNFSVGDYVFWSATACENNDTRILNKKITIDYSYEGCAIGKGNLIGKVEKITLLKNIEKNLYEEIGDYNSADELCENDKAENNMLIVLSETEYKVYSDNDKEPRVEIMVAWEMKDKAIDILKQIKKMGYNINLIGKDENKLIKVHNELKKVKSFSNSDYLVDDLEKYGSYDKIEYNFPKNWVLFSRNDIFENMKKNLILKYIGQYVIYNIDFENKKIDYYYNVGDYGSLSFDELKKEKLLSCIIDEILI